MPRQTEGQMEGRTEGWTKRRMQGRKDGQTLFHRSLPANAKGPMKTNYIKLKTIDPEISSNLIF